MQIVHECQDDIKRVLQDKRIQQELDILVLRLDVVSATELWLSINVTARQWDAIAKELNSRLPQGVKHHKEGGVMPTSSRMNNWCAHNL